MSAVIPGTAVGTPLPKPDKLAQFTEQSGALTDHAIQFLTMFREFIVGMNRITPCSASGTNTITLTPNTAAPLITKYLDYEVFAFTAANTSTGNVTATVVPRTGTLATLKVYKSDGAAQAGAGDIVQNCIYLLVYGDHLDSNAGGFVKK